MYNQFVSSTYCLSHLLSCIQKTYNKPLFLTGIRDGPYIELKSSSQLFIHSVPTTPSRNMFKPELSIDISFIFYLIRDEGGLENLLLCLRPIFASTWFVLTLNIDHWFLMARSAKTSPFRAFFDALDYRERATTRDLQQFDHLVLNIDNPRIRVSLMPLRTLIWTYLHTRNHFAKLYQTRFIIQACISRVSDGDIPGWRLTLAFKDGVCPVRDGIWRLGEAGVRSLWIGYSNPWNMCTRIPTFRP
jgi:hypothetical protein